MSSPLFEVKSLHAAAGAEPGNDILKGVSLTVNSGEIHAVMGPNGSGKTTLASVLMGSPEYVVTSGSLAYKGSDISGWTTDERSRAGIFLAFQYPQEIPGVPMRQFLRQALGARRDIEDMSVLEVRIMMMEWMEKLKMDPAFADRYLNEGFSGGEKKRNEILQMALLEPEIAILDETDSGLDIDALKVVAQGVNTVRTSQPDMGAIVITHYQRLLEHLVPDFVHILIDGRIVETGGTELARQLDDKGFDAWKHLAADGDEVLSETTA